MLNLWPKTRHSTVISIPHRNNLLSSEELERWASKCLGQEERCVCAWLLSHVWLFLTPWTVATRFLCPWNSPGKDTGVGCHSVYLILTHTSNSSSQGDLLPSQDSVIQMPLLFICFSSPSLRCQLSPLCWKYSIHPVISFVPNLLTFLVHIFPPQFFFFVEIIYIYTICICAVCVLYIYIHTPTKGFPAASNSKERESESHWAVSDSLRPHGLYNPWNSLGQNTGVNSRSLLQETFPTQGSNPGLLYCRQILYQLSQQGSPDSKESACSVGGPGLISGSGRSPGGGNGNWTIRRTEEPGRLQSMVSQRVGHNWATNTSISYVHTKPPIYERVPRAHSQV